MPSCLKVLFGLSALVFVGCASSPAAPTASPEDGLALEESTRGPASDRAFNCKSRGGPDGLSLALSARSTVIEVKSTGTDEIHSFAWTGDWDATYTQEHPGKILYRMRRSGTDHTRLIGDFSLLKGKNSNVRLEGRTRGYWFADYVCSLKN